MTHFPDISDDEFADVLKALLKLAAMDDDDDEDQGDDDESG